MLKSKIIVDITGVLKTLLEKSKLDNMPDKIQTIFQNKLKEFANKEFSMLIDMPTKSIIHNRPSTYSKFLINPLFEIIYPPNFIKQENNKIFKL